MLSTEDARGTAIAIVAALIAVLIGFAFPALLYIAALAAIIMLMIRTRPNSE